MENLANFVGCLHTEMECSHIIDLAMKGHLIRLKHRLNEKEKRMIQPGHAFVYLEEESGIIRWTDSRSWTPSRALGPFMMYIEKKGDPTLIKKIYTARYDDKVVHIVIYNVYQDEENNNCCEIYRKVRNTVIPESYGKMARTYLGLKKKKIPTVKSLNLDQTIQKRYECNTGRLFLEDSSSMQERFNIYNRNVYDNITQYGEVYSQYLSSDQYMSQRDSYTKYYGENFVGENNDKRYLNNSVKNVDYEEKFINQKNVTKIYNDDYATKIYNDDYATKIYNDDYATKMYNDDYATKMYNDDYATKMYNEFCVTDQYNKDYLIESYNNKHGLETYEDKKYLTDTYEDKNYINTSYDKASYIDLHNDEIPKNPIEKANDEIKEENDEK